MKIQELLEELRRTPGVKAAALLTADGLAAAESLDPAFRSDVVAGLTSFLLTTTNRSLRDAGLGGCTQFELHASHGRALVLALDESCLVVMCDQFADLQAARREAQDTARRIRLCARLAR